MSRIQLNQPATDTDNWKCQNAKTTMHLFYWTITWLVTTALLVFGSQLLWNFNTLLTTVAFLLNMGVGFGMILAVRRHFRGLDEMQQKIQLEAMALSLGLGLVIGASFRHLADIHFITFKPEISHLMIVMAITYIAGIIIGNRRYQ